MQVQEVSLVDITSRAFCRSSAELWWRLRPEPSTEIAFQVFHNSTVQVEALCRFVTTGPSSSRIYLTHLHASTLNRDALEILFDAVTARHAPPSHTTMVAFVEDEASAATLLRNAGWIFERRFPVQLRWRSLSDRDMYTQERPPKLLIRETSDVDCAADLFVRAFWDQWQWYFEELGYRPGVTSSGELHQLACRYVEGADTYLVGTIDNAPVALSAVLVNVHNKVGILHTGVGVLPEARGQGLGKMMVKESLDWLRKRGINEAEICTQERLGQRNSNMAMYESTGAQRQRCFWLCSPPKAG